MIKLVFQVLFEIRACITAIDIEQSLCLYNRERDSLHRLLVDSWAMFAVFSPSTGFGSWNDWGHSWSSLGLVHAVFS